MYFALGLCKRASTTSFYENKIKNKMKLLKCIGVQNILTVQCAEINAARQRGNVRSPHDTSCAIISYTIRDQSSHSPGLAARCTRTFRISPSFSKLRRFYISNIFYIYSRTASPAFGFIVGSRAVQHYLSQKLCT